MNWRPCLLQIILVSTELYSTAVLTELSNTLAMSSAILLHCSQYYSDSATARWAQSECLPPKLSTVRVLSESPKKSESMLDPKKFFGFLLIFKVQYLNKKKKNNSIQQLTFLQQSTVLIWRDGLFTYSAPQSNALNNTALYWVSCRLQPSLLGCASLCQSTCRGDRQDWAAKDNLELPLRPIQATQMTTGPFWTRQTRLEAFWTSNRNLATWKRFSIEGAKLFTKALIQVCTLLS